MIKKTHILHSAPQFHKENSTRSTKCIIITIILGKETLQNGGQ
jgi:hypothetical protein